MEFRNLHSGIPGSQPVFPRNTYRNADSNPRSADLNYAGRRQDFLRAPPPRPRAVNPPTLRQMFYYPENLRQLFRAFIGHQRAHRKHIPADLGHRFKIWLQQWGENDYLNQSPRGHAMFVSDDQSLRDENYRFIAFYADPVADLGAAIAVVNDQRMPKSQIRPDGPYVGARGAPGPTRVASNSWKAIRVGSADPSTSDGRLPVHPHGDFSLLLEGTGHSEPYQGPDGVQRREARLAAEVRVRERLQQRQIRDTVNPMREPLLLNGVNGQLMQKTRGAPLTHEDYEAVQLPLQKPVTQIVRNTSGRYVKSASRALHSSSRTQWADETLNANYSLGCIIPAKQMY